MGGTLVAPTNWSNKPMAKDPVKDPEFKRVLGNLLKSKPKPHSEMKVGEKKKPRKKKAKNAD